MEMSTWKQGWGERSRPWISIQVAVGHVGERPGSDTPRPDHVGFSGGHVDGVVHFSFSVAHSRLLQQSPGVTWSTGPRAGRGRRTCYSCSPSLPGSLPTGPHPTSQPASQRQPHYYPSMAMLGSISSEARLEKPRGSFLAAPTLLVWTPELEAQFHVS